MEDNQKIKSKDRGPNVRLITAGRKCGFEPLGQLAGGELPDAPPPISGTVRLAPAAHVEGPPVRFMS